MFIICNKLATELTCFCKILFSVQLWSLLPQVTESPTQTGYKPGRAALTWAGQAERLPVIPIVLSSSGCWLILAWAQQEFSSSSQLSTTQKGMVFLGEQGRISPELPSKLPECHWPQSGHMSIPEPITDTWASFLSQAEGQLLWHMHLVCAGVGGMSWIKLGSVWRRLLGMQPIHNVIVPRRRGLGEYATHPRGVNGPSGGIL